MDGLDKMDLTSKVTGSLCHINCHVLACILSFTSFSINILTFLFQFKLALSHDGSGKGAALVAAVAMRLRDMKKKQEISYDMSENSI